ncbi:MAG: asparagine synthase (glutamine-hydrolyzing) [Anaerolineales bacterium]|nr:asparagine synthase (glutamine-hydrolyzing) [Anaerolineales bacterium]
MCGLSGLISPDLPRDRLERVNNLLEHRGPDDAGVYTDEGIGLTVRRLSIIDLTGGHQPISNENKDIWLVLNGEIFNAPALRCELEAAGHLFSTCTDTETVVHAYEQWGDEAFSRLRGMFAFALWEKKRQRLILGRDRFGIKPLYYAHSGSKLAFASEILPILELMPEIPRQANPEALWRLFEIGFIPCPWTAFMGIFKLSPGHILICQGGQVNIRAYWQLRYSSDSEQIRFSLRQASQEFIEQLIETVNAWRMSDVPVASLLSGGIDSSALAAVLTEVSGAPIRTFNIGFANWERDEAVQARATAQFIGSQHTEIVFTLADFDLLPRVVNRLEEPECSGTSVALYLLYQACHQAGYKVVMTGEGSDELLGGYPWYQGDQRVRPFLRLPPSLRGLVANLAAPVFRGSRRVLLQGSADPIQRYILWQRADLPRKIEALLKGEPPPSLLQVWHEQYAQTIQGYHPLHQMLYLESQTRLANYVNLMMDRMSMAHSVEARPPFLDHQLWEFTARFSPRVKLGWHENKRLLRHGMQGRLPAPVLQRPKKGLSAPENIWWRSARLPIWASELMQPGALEESGYFKTREIIRLLQLHQNGKVNLGRLLTGILTTQLWHFQVLKPS